MQPTPLVYGTIPDTHEVKLSQPSKEGLQRWSLHIPKCSISLLKTALILAQFS